MSGSNEIPTWIMALIALGFFGGLGGVAFFIHERRRRGFEALAQARGLIFHELAPRNVRLPGEFIKDVERGLTVNTRHRRALELNDGEGRILVCELLRYRADSGGGERGHYALSVGMIECEGADLPKFTLDPERLRQKLAVPGHGRDIDFEDSPRFSRSYVLREAAEPTIRAWFTRDRRAFFEERSGWHIRTYGTRFVFFRSPRLLQWSAFRPATAERLLDAGLEFRQLLEREV